MRIFLSAVLALAAAAPAEAGEAFIGAPVLAIEIVCPKEYDAGLLREHIPLKDGEEFDPGLLRDGIKALYRTALFSSVSAFVNEAEGGIIITIEMTSKQYIGEITVEGNSVFSSEDLKDAFGLKPNDEFIVDKVVSRLGGIARLYAEAGYRNVQVTPDTDDIGDGKVNLILRIDEGAPTRITDIQFTGELFFEEKRLADVVGLWKGMLLNVKLLREKRSILFEFYRKEGYLEAEISDPVIIKGKSDRWKKVLFRVKAGMKVKFVFVGNERFPADILMSSLKMEEERKLTPTGLQLLAGELKSFYELRGFFNAKVSARTVVLEGGKEKAVVFLISEGEQVLLKDMSFRGNRFASGETLRTIFDSSAEDFLKSKDISTPLDKGDLHALGMSGVPQPYIETHEPAISDLSPEEIYTPEKVEEGLRFIEEFYRSEGFPDISIAPPQTSFSRNGERVSISVTVQEGPMVIIDRIEISGNEKFGSDTILNVLPFKVGSPLNDLRIEEARRTILTLYREHGYIFCAVKYDVARTGETGDKAVVSFAVSEGYQAKAGIILVKNNKRTKEKVILDRVDIEPGEVLKSGRIREAERDVNDLGVFSAVVVRPINADEPEQFKDVIVEVKERMPRRILRKMGLSSDDGVRGSLEYTNINLGGYAVGFVASGKFNHQVPLFLQWQGLPEYEQYSKYFDDLPAYKRIEREIDVGFFYPRVYGIGIDVSPRVDLVHQRENQIAFGYDRAGVIPRLDTQLTEAADFSLQYQFELNDVAPTGVGETPPKLAKGKSILHIPRATLSYDARDNRFVPTRGVLASLSTEIGRSMGELFGLESTINVNYLKMTAAVTGYVPMPLRMVLAVQLKGGDIVSFARSSGGEKIEAPLNKQFSLGGRASLRGWPENSVPAYDSGDDRGYAIDTSDNLYKPASLTGNIFVLTKAEIRIPVSGAIAVGIFMDAGNLWKESETADVLKLRKTAGMGMRYNTPVGAVAFDIGFKLDRSRLFNEELFNLHFSIGVF